MDREAIIAAAEQFVQQELGSDSSGHDYWHIFRVWQTAKKIGQVEGADLFIVELAALLHDLADEKLNESEAAGLAKVRGWLEAQDVAVEEVDHVMEIISTMSFKGGNKPGMRTLEGAVVQDADRLDALGAVGIARTFAYSGAKGQLPHDPQLKPRTDMTAQEYRQGKSTAINHFYEKLLKLKELMNTAYGRQMAEGRHRVMEAFLEQFYAEWEGQR
ncbi:phosphohydrolase [Tumebacillus algifaecis]|uniref:Phosphohydrolase n=1 Tax=Tumebacillus algifaecis TaxID=1214604 RepID=A0A223CZ29_9BACL|nr:HD domain-containing protein [Tumebacillus algifaecis]ASS74709.1 phosphohydrolase [Tumebacillus algifaecis]